MVKVEWQERGVYWKYTGSVSGEEIVNASIAIYADRRFDDLKYKLCDFLDADSITMAPMEMDKVVCQHAAAALSNGDIKIAVVGKKADIPALSLLVEHFKNYELKASWPIELFEDLTAAQAWLAN
jgi:hypothetical protein